MSEDSLTKRAQVVPTLQARNDPPFAGVARPLLHGFCHGNEVLVFERSVTERVALVGIKTRGQDSRDQV